MNRYLDVDDRVDAHIERLEAQLDELRADNTELKAENAALRHALERAEAGYLRLMEESSRSGRGNVDTSVF